ncbi:50S ribosomal protein L24 [Mucilaginibacter flavus]|uniref:50S ribosomal protein L24 n=1 Tax=Mucilaginibacter flavus TaxID=931504 RepID=UPI0025B321F5|nr:50S ribosomal protein L24 [Mucilaginibacter flavus]MDN3579345.1 50S ribosomal protein L24 [Mucilaginibacter flavus]
MEKKKIATPGKLKIRKGDLVKVIAGDSKGSQGKIVEVLVDRNRAVVEGANLVSKHTKPNAANPNGGIVKQEAAIHISNLALVDPKTGATTRVGRKKNDAGKLVRVSKKSGEEIK